MAASAPEDITVIWVPGLMHTPKHYEPMIEVLSHYGIRGIAVSLASVGSNAPSCALGDDVKVIQAELGKVVEEGRHVVLISHSYGGVPACQAIRGHTKAERQAAGKRGGIVCAVWLAAFVLPEGMSTWIAKQGDLPPPWGKRVGDLWFPIHDLCKSAFYHDLPEEQQLYWTNQLEQAAHNHCTTPVGRACWDLNVRKAYIVTDNDEALTPDIQETMLQPVKDKTWTVKHIASSHSPFLSRKDELARIIIGLAIDAMS